MTKEINKTDFSYYNQLKSTGKCKRKIVELFFRIVCNFWRTLGSYFLKVPLTKEESKLIEDTKTRVKALGDHTQRTVVQLQRKRMLGPEAVIEYTEYALKDKNVGLVKNFLLDHGTDKLPKIPEDKLIFIPVVLKSWPCEHIVAFVYDRKNNCLEFYDPKGLVILDRKEQTLKNL